MVPLGVHFISRTGKEGLNEEFNSTYQVNFFSCIADAKDEESLVRSCNKILTNDRNKIDIVISNVGNGKGTQMPVSDITDWSRSWDTNFNSALNVSRVFTPELLKSTGSLIFI